MAAAGGDAAAAEAALVERLAVLQAASGGDGNGGGAAAAAARQQWYADALAFLQAHGGEHWWCHHADVTAGAPAWGRLEGQRRCSLLSPLAATAFADCNGRPLGPGPLPCRPGRGAALPR